MGVGEWVGEWVGGWDVPLETSLLEGGVRFRHELFHLYRGERVGGWVNEQE